MESFSWYSLQSWEFKLVEMVKRRQRSGDDPVCRNRKSTGAWHSPRGVPGTQSALNLNHRRGSAKSTRRRRCVPSDLSGFIIPLYNYSFLNKKLQRK
jgi:hypothetical protein